MFFCFIRLHELLIQVVEHKFCFKKRIVIIYDELYACLVLASIFSFLVQLVDKALHLSDASKSVHFPQVGVCIKVETINDNLFWVAFVFVEYLFQAQDWLIS